MEKEWLKVYSPETNPATGEKFAAWLKQLRVSHDGRCDIDGLLATEYGRQLTELQRERFELEEVTHGEACREFYRALGVRREEFGDGDFYSRWTLFSPLDRPEGKKFPLIVWNHGGANAIETDEFSVRFTRMAGREKFMVLMLQDTGWQNARRVLDIVERDWPVDTERVYVAGYSQGGQAAHSAMIRMPERFAAAAPCGAETFQLWDHLDVRYTLEEIEHLRDVFVPVVQITGEYEHLSYLPNNHYAPIVNKTPEPGARATTYCIPGHDLALDPTNPPGKRADKPYPPKNTDPDRWKLSRLQLRLHTLRCAPVDEARCLAYREHPEDKFHYALGFTGDREETRCIGGVEHYIADVFNDGGLLAYRSIAVGGFLHWPSMMLAEQCWEFFRNFRRDSASGVVVRDPYEG